MEARKRQHKRFSAEKNTYSHAQMAAKMIREHCAISVDGEKLPKMRFRDWAFPRALTIAS
jgi:predicted ATPase with chaperone activity